MVTHHHPQAGRIFLLLSLLLICLGTPSRALSQTPPSPGGSGPTLEEARQLRDAGRLPESASAYQEFVAAHPDLWQARYEFAQVLMALKQFDGAERQLQSVLVASPREEAAWARLGQVYLLKNDMASAERSLKIARDLNPKDPGVRYNLGRLYEMQARDPEAVAEYSAFIDIAGADPRVVGVRRRLAAYYESEKKLVEAVAQYRALVELSPQNVKYHQLVADRLYLQGAYDEALVEYHKILAMDPNNAPAHFNVGFIAKMKGNVDEAERELKIADTLAPGSTKTLYQLGAVEFERGNYEVAATYFEKVVGADPDHPQAHYHYSRTLAKLGRVEEARRQIEIHKEVLKKTEANKNVPNSMETTPAD